MAQTKVEKSMTLDLNHALNFALKSAEKAAPLLLNAELLSDGIHKKGRIDLVTSVDLAVNALLCEELSHFDAQIDIIAEEGVPSHLRNPGGELVWVIDPIDGTTNFVHGLKQSAISIALYDRSVEQSLVAVVFNPFRNECFTAFKGGGAFLNHQPIVVSKTDALENALLCTGFSYEASTRSDNNLAEFTAFLPLIQGMRRLGAASLDLAYVACGRLDGYFEQGLKFWDYAAGMLIVKEAHGAVSQYDGGALTPDSGHIIAANMSLFSPMLSILQTVRHHAGLSPNP